MSEPTGISATNQLMMQGFSSPSLFIDNAIALETSKMIQKAMASKKRVAIFVTILTIVGIDGIKKVITKFIDLFISWCQDMSWEKLQTGVSFLKAVFRWFFSLLSFARVVPQKTIVKKDKNNKESLETVRFATNNIFWKAVMNHPSFSCNLIVTKLSICDGTGMMQQDELWMDSKIETPEWTAYLLKTMSFSTQLVKNRREFLEDKTGELIQDLTKISLTEPDETSPYCPKLLGNYPRVTKRSGQYVLKCKSEIGNDEISLDRLYLLNKIPTELYLIADVVFDLMYEITSFECRMTLKTQIPFKNDKSVCVDKIGMTSLWMYLLQCTYSEPHYARLDYLCNVYLLLIMTCISFQYNEVYYSTIFRQTHNVILIDTNGFGMYIGRDKQTRTEYNIPQTLGTKELDGIKEFVTEHINPKLDANPKIKSLLPLFRHWFITTLQLDRILGYNPEDAKAKAESSDNNELSLFIQSKTPTQQPSPVKLLQSFSTFSKQLIQDYTTQREGSPVAIKYLRIVENTITSKTENPEYKEWKELYAPKTPQNESNSETKESKSSNDTMLLTYLIKTNGSNSSVPISPPMYITETTVKREVSVEQVNNSYKNVKTLYLCDQDKKKLFSSLDVFKYKRDLLESLGLPHKLGVLLYGEPGCGKSSAILAIASFLQKDIFYIDLKTVKTNRELKMIFDHVYTLNANGGVIAMEDIDCASNIVLQRKEIITGEGSISCDGDNLTLDFLLNLLQGTLTKDGTVFVATTNYIQKLDTALVRDGRFDVKIELKKCNREQLSQMFEIFFGMKLSESLLHRFREFQFIPATILSRMSEYLTSGNVIIPEEVLCPFLNV